MRTHSVVTRDDLDLAFHDADEVGSPDGVIERIMAAVDDPALRGTDFTVGAALVTVSDLQMRFGRPADAETTLRAAVAADSRDEVVDARAWLAALLVDLGRPEEAAREFAVLKRSGRAGADEHLVYGEALEASGDFTAAVNVFAAGELAAERSGDTTSVTMLRRSADRARNGGVPIMPRFRVPALAASDQLRDEFSDVFPGVFPDELPDEDDDVLVLFFLPRADHERVVETWPALAEEIGRDWDEHRGRLETALTGATDEGATAVVAVVDFASLRTYAGEPGTTPPRFDDYLSRHAETTEFLGWPPERNAPCWCGSGQKYKRCCRPRAFR